MLSEADLYNYFLRLIAFPNATICRHAVMADLLSLMEERGAELDPDIVAAIVEARDGDAREGVVAHLTTLSEAEYPTPPLTVHNLDDYSEIRAGGMPIARRYKHKVYILDNGVAKGRYRYRQMSSAYREMWRSCQVVAEQYIPDQFDPSDRRTAA